MEVINKRVVKSTCSFPNVGFVFNSSIGLSRGILVAWNSDFWQ